MQPISIEMSLILMRGALLVMGLLVFAWGFRQWRRGAERDAQRIFEQLDLIRGELLLLSDRLEQLESAGPKIIERTTVQPEVRAPLPAPNGGSAPRGYEVAARLARGGATCEELMSSCGLSRHEAELLLRLHKADAARNAAHPKAGEDRRSRLSVVG